MQVTIAEAAGIINVGVVLLQLTFPLIITFVLVGFATHVGNAATWSVTGRLLNGTWWPTILRTDVSTATHVSKRVLFISALSTAGLLLLAVAAILTPLGLYDQLVETPNSVADFAYVSDTSPIGVYTPDRSDYNVSRLCGMAGYKSCPGQYHGLSYSATSSTGYVSSGSSDDYISSVMPDNLTEVFSSGRDGNLSTVATVLDLQYRAYFLQNNPDDGLILQGNDTAMPNIDQQRVRSVGDFKTYSNYLLADDFVVQDGIVADMKNGGIGFRNHTLPVDAQMGMQWTESLLWVEPESVCISNNVSIQFQTAKAGTSGGTYYLVDDGGLLTIQTGLEYPEYDVDHTETDPELYARAFKGATLMNFNLALLMNVSAKRNTTYKGRRYSLPVTLEYGPGLLTTGAFDGGIPNMDTNALVRPQSTSAANSSDISSSSDLISEIDTLVMGYGGADMANISRIAASGGVVVGSPIKFQNDSTQRNDPGSNYTAPVYSCATVLKAYVMDVTFFINGTSELQNLKVQSVTPRQYQNSSLPVWAIEKSPSDFTVADMNPLWGIVGSNYTNDDRFWTTVRDYFYLPAGMSSFTFGSLLAVDSLASGVFENLLSVLYSNLGPESKGDYYSGKQSEPLTQKWMNMSQSADTIPTMMSLIWTDTAINTLTSRRSQLNAGLPSVTTTEQAAQQVSHATVALKPTLYSLTVQYHSVYAIPALIFVLAYLSVVTTAIVFCVTGQSTLASLKSLLNQTSVGRAVLAERYEQIDANASARLRSMTTRDWVEQHGTEDIDISKNAAYHLIKTEKMRALLESDYEYSAGAIKLQEG